MSDRFEKIVALENEIQARVLTSILRDRGIPHAMHSYYSGPYDGVFQLGAGWGHVEAPARFREEILAILDEMERDTPSAEDNGSKEWNGAENASSRAHVDQPARRSRALLCAMIWPLLGLVVGMLLLWGASAIEWHLRVLVLVVALLLADIWAIVLLSIRIHAREREELTGSAADRDSLLTQGALLPFLVVSTVILAPPLVRNVIIKDFIIMAMGIVACWFGVKTLLQALKLDDRKLRTAYYAAGTTALIVTALSWLAGFWCL